MPLKARGPLIMNHRVASLVFRMTVVSNASITYLRITDVANEN